MLPNDRRNAAHFSPPLRGRYVLHSLRDRRWTGRASAPRTGNNDAAKEIGQRSACFCRHCLPDRLSGRSPESRSGQTGAKAVFGELRVLPSQPARPRQGPLQAHALSVPAKTLRQRFQFGLGARVLSGIRREREARPIARRGEAAGCHDRPVTVVLPSAGVGAGAVGPRGYATACSRRRCEISSPRTSFRLLRGYREELCARGGE